MVCKKGLLGSAVKADPPDKKKTWEWVEATPKSPVKGNNVLATYNNWKQVSDKNVPTEMDAPVKTTAGESPICWKSPPSCVINIVEFLEEAKSYAHLVKEDVHELKMFEKRMVSVFVGRTAAHCLEIAERELIKTPL